MFVFFATIGKCATYEIFRFLFFNLESLPRSVNFNRYEAVTTQCKNPCTMSTEPKTTAQNPLKHNKKNEQRNPGPQRFLFRGKMFINKWWQSVDHYFVAIKQFDNYKTVINARKDEHTFATFILLQILFDSFLFTLFAKRRGYEWRCEPLVYSIVVQISKLQNLPAQIGRQSRRSVINRATPKQISVGISFVSLHFGRTQAAQHMTAWGESLSISVV